METRRNAMKKIVGGAAVMATVSSLSNRIEAAEKVMDAPLKGRINHSVCRWCYNTIALDDLCKASVEMGIQSIEIIGPKDFATIQKYGLSCGMVSGGSIVKGWNKKEQHDAHVEEYMKLIDDVSNAGFKNLICFSGNRDKDVNDEQGLENCAKGLKRIMSHAEKKKVTIVMELLNSKVNHKDYMCDHTKWGVELCKKIDSDNFKLLYDIYHMQIMDGDVISHIREYNKYFAHYHTGGVPGRNEIDETQELYYPAIMAAILETGYKGLVAQEFVPKRADKLASLKQGVTICDI
jgi:hydroxypyruvate isomerase